MSELDPEEEAVLETARRALTPPEQVTRRMRAALVAKLAAPGVIAATSAAAASAGAAAGSSAGSAAAASTVAAATSAAAGAAASGSTVASGATAAASAAFLKAALGVATAAVLATATSPYWLPATTGSVPSTSAVAPAPAAPAPTLPLAGRTAPGARALAAPQARPEPKPAQQRSTANVVANEAASPGREAPALKLQGELDGLRQVQQAIQGGQPTRALELLGELDAAYPASTLWQEREVARVLALCGVGRVAAAREIAQRVLAVSPDSLYASRIQSSCAGQSLAAPAAPAQSRTPAPPSVEGPGKSTHGAPPVARFGDSGN